MELLQSRLNRSLHDCLLCGVLMQEPMTASLLGVYQVPIHSDLKVARCTRILDRLHGNFWEPALNEGLGCTEPRPIASPTAPLNRNLGRFSGGGGGGGRGRGRGEDRFGGLCLYFWLRHFIKAEAVVIHNYFAICANNHMVGDVCEPELVRETLGWDAPMLDIAEFTRLKFLRLFHSFNVQQKNVDLVTVSGRVSVHLLRRGATSTSP